MSEKHVVERTLEEFFKRSDLFYGKSEIERFGIKVYQRAIEQERSRVLKEVDSRLKYLEFVKILQDKEVFREMVVFGINELKQLKSSIQPAENEADIGLAKHKDSTPHPVSTSGSAASSVKGDDDGVEDITQEIIDKALGTEKDVAEDKTVEVSGKPVDIARSNSSSAQQSSEMPNEPRCGNDKCKGTYHHPSCFDSGFDEFECQACEGKWYQQRDNPRFILLSPDMVHGGHKSDCPMSKYGYNGEKNE